MIDKVSMRLLFFLSILALTFSYGKPIVSLAKPHFYQDYKTWTDPINLSNSGSTSNSQLIIDSNGRFYALWVDEYEGYVVASSADGVVWNQPVPVNFPFRINDGSPVFVSDSIGYIHAFWNDNTNALYYSRVVAKNFTSGVAWGETKQLAESAVDFSIVVDEQQMIHLVYVRILSTGESPSGIYYRSSKDNGENWFYSKMLYQSQYLRSLRPGEANVRITYNEGGIEYVVWDNHSLKLILFTKSVDRGYSWTEPKVIRGPKDDDGNNIPFGINVAANENGALMIWHLGQPDANCDQYSQWSTDGGDSWSSPFLISQNNYGCSPESKLFNIQDGLILFRTNMEDQSRLLAWNGSQWSNRQNIITSFSDPETYNSISFNVQQTLYDGSGQLYVIGYDDGGIGDTWLIVRSVETISDWFPNPSHWSGPQGIYSTPSEIYSFSISADEMNQFHLLWIQNNLSDGQETSSIYYSKWDGSQWTQPQAIYTASQGVISQLNTSVDKERLMLVWSEGLNNEVHYSWSNTNTSQNVSEWATPVQLSTTLITGISPQILSFNLGTIYVVYSKPINEGRGIYIVESTNEGRDWSPPRLIFDADAAGWEIADLPVLATNLNGSVNVIWAKKSFPENGHLLALYSSQFDGSSSIWSTPSIVEEGNLTWGQIIGSDVNFIYRIWQEVDNSTLLVNWFQFSADGGVNWSVPTSVTDPEPDLGSPAVTTDKAGRLYLFQPIQITQQIRGITYRIWDKDRWLIGDRIILNNSQYIPGSTTVAISPSGNLILTFIESETNSSTGSINHKLSFVSQIVDVPQISPPAVSSPQVYDPTQTFIATTDSPSAETPTITPTPYQQVVNNTSPSSRNLSVIALFLGISGIIILALILAFYYIVSSKRIK